MKFIEFELQRETHVLFEAFHKNPYSFFLDDSSEMGWSFMGTFPYTIVTSLEALEKELNRFSNIKTSLPSMMMDFPFIGGAVGFISYEAVRLWEKHLSSSKKEPFHMPPILFGLYDTFLAFNHKNKKGFIVSLELTSDSSKKLDYFKTILSKEVKMQYSFTPALIHSNLSFDEYCQMVNKAKHYIREGEIYQVNLSHCLNFSDHKPPYSIYKKLRKLNPASYSAFLHFGEHHILSSSPERFLFINQEGQIQTEPIKGTIHRGKTVKEDEILKQTLLSSEKNKAELMMIVDLERNDLGKICSLGSVKVPILSELRTFATVHHLVSVIQGQLKTKSLSQIIQSTFPGGSITGAPKLRAMQIIDELEPHNRGIYTGSIGYIDYRGQMDLNIAIRTIIHQKGHFYVPVGGGITCLSNAKEEYEESLYKISWAMNSSKEL